jgi:hypothetical protein
MPTRPEAPGRRASTTEPVGEADAYSILEFCQRHRISLPMYYKLRQHRLAPIEFHVGSRVLISKESAAQWRRERELATRQKSA